MLRNHSNRAPVAHTKPSNPTWEAVKWLIAVLAVTSICHTLLTAGGVL